MLISFHFCTGAKK